MRVSDFLAESDRYLNRGDIILTRGNYLSSRLIRLIIGGFFSHAALVFLVPQRSRDFNNTFVLESMPTGIGLAKLSSYIGGKYPSEEVAILRMTGAGFDAAYFKQVGALMLDYVKTSYDFGRAINLGLSLFFPADAKMGTERAALFGFEKMGAIAIHLQWLYPIRLCGSLAA